jgi:surfactin synthase thioesterase subunit
MGTHAQDWDRRWFKRFGRRGTSGDVRLLCFHHAGGSAGMFRPWPAALPASVETVGVQLPGRADRFHEPAYDRMEPLVEALLDAVKPLLDRPFACYGVSMGARVAWALTRALSDRAMPLPRTLFVACDPAPVNDDGSWPWQERDVEEFVRELGATPPEVLDHREFFAALLPRMRADLAVLSSPGPRPATPLDIPIHAFAGRADPAAPPDQMTGWRAETTAGFQLDVLECGHFFDTVAEARVIETVGRILG